MGESGPEEAIRSLQLISSRPSSPLLAPFDLPPSATTTGVAFESERSMEVYSVQCVVQHQTDHFQKLLEVCTVLAEAIFLKCCA